MLLGRIKEICERFDPISLKVAETAEQSLAIWKGRKGAFGAMGRIAPDIMLQDAVVPRSRLPEVLAAPMTLVPGDRLLEALQAPLLVLRVEEVVQDLADILADLAQRRHQLHA